MNGERPEALRHITECRAECEAGRKNRVSVFRCSEGGHNSHLSFTSQLALKLARSNLKSLWESIYDPWEAEGAMTCLARSGDKVSAILSVVEKRNKIYRFFTVSMTAFSGSSLTLWMWLIYDSFFFSLSPSSPHILQSFKREYLNISPRNLRQT